MATLTLVGGIGAVALAVRQLARSRQQAEAQAIKVTQVSVEQRAEQLTHNLGQAVRAVAAITGELQQEADTARQLVERFKRAVQARCRDLRAARHDQPGPSRLIQDQVQTEIRTESRRNFRANLMLNGLFFILGVAAGALIQVLLR